MTGTFEGVGSLQFTPDNKFAYAMTGAVSVGGALQTVLDFTTESYYLVAKYLPIYFTNNSEDFLFEVYFNDVLILGNVVDDQDNQIFNWNPLIIPPFTNVKVKITSLNTTSRNVGCLITAEVYGAIEQENLEAITNNNKWASL